MTGFAVFRCRLVEQNHRSLNEAVIGVAGGAGDILMSAFEREAGLLVIEKRGPPLVGVVACFTLAGLFRELIGVGILMAIAAMDGGFRELDVQHGPLKIGRPVAGGALSGAMRAGERKTRGVMIELR